MNKKFGLVVILVIAIIITTIVLRAPRVEEHRIVAYEGDTFEISAECEHIALIGCTPNPTYYVEEKGNNLDCLGNLRAADFLDIDYVIDSFVRTVSICKEQAVDHLIVAYLPIYFIRLRPLLGVNFVPLCSQFLAGIKDDMVSIIKRAADRVDYKGMITLIIPPLEQLGRVPLKINGIDERIRYLIKQFPKLLNISSSSLTTITIINNEQSAEDEMIISYLKYEYLFEKPITYRTASAGKKQFHKGK